MADVNSFSFTGRLGADGVVHQTATGKSVLELSVAVASGYGDFKKTMWIKVKMWGERANNVVGIFKKGALVGGTGELSTDDWTAKDGTTKTSIVVTCMNVQLLQSKQASSEAAPVEAAPVANEEPVF